jgi:hypothetical protein
MVITSRMHRALTFIALVLILALLLETFVGHRLSSQHVTASSETVATSKYHDPYDGGYHVARGRLLWQWTHQSQRVSLQVLEPYVKIDNRGRVTGAGGQYVARLMAVQLGTIATC